MSGMWAKTQIWHTSESLRVKHKAGTTSHNLRVDLLFTPPPLIKAKSRPASALGRLQKKVVKSPETTDSPEGRPSTAEVQRLSTRSAPLQSLAAPGTKKEAQTITFRRRGADSQDGIDARKTLGRDVQGNRGSPQDRSSLKSRALRSSIYIPSQKGEQLLASEGGSGSRGPAARRRGGLVFDRNQLGPRNGSVLPKTEDALKQLQSNALSAAFNPMMLPDRNARNRKKTAQLAADGSNEPMLSKSRPSSVSTGRKGSIQTAQQFALRTAMPVLPNSQVLECLMDCNVELLRNFDMEHLQAIAANAKTRELLDGSNVISPGEQWMSPILVISGRLIVVHEEKRITSRSRSQVLGFASAICMEHCHITIRAKTETVIAEINRKDVLRALDYWVAPMLKANFFVLQLLFAEDLRAKPTGNVETSLVARWEHRLKDEEIVQHDGTAKELSVFHEKQGDIDLAVYHLENQLKESEQAQNLDQMLSTLWDLARLYERHEMPDSAKECYLRMKGTLDHTLDTAKNLSWQIWDYIAKLGLRNCCQADGHSKDLMKWTNECLEIERVQGELAAEVNSLAILADAHEALGLLDEAVRTRKMELHFTESSLAPILNPHEDYDLLFQLTIEPLQEFAIYSMCLALSNIGESYELFGQKEAYYRKARALRDYTPEADYRYLVSEQVALKGPKLIGARKWERGDEVTVVGGVRNDGYFFVQKQNQKGVVPSTYLRVEDSKSGSELIDIAHDYHTQHLRYARNENNRLSECVALANLGITTQVREQCLSGSKQMDDDRSVPIGRSPPNAKGRSGNLDMSAMDYHLRHLRIAEEMEDLECQHLARTNIMLLNSSTLPGNQERHALKNLMLRARPEPHDPPNLALIA